MDLAWPFVFLAACGLTFAGFYLWLRFKKTLVTEKKLEQDVKAHLAHFQSELLKVQTQLSQVQAAMAYSKDFPGF